jgi:hypothetical protein
MGTDLNVKSPQNSEIAHLEMCASLAATAPQGEICKKKLPLRYMSMLLANALLLHEASPSVLPKFVTPHSGILADRANPYPVGQLPSLFRPPRA